MIDKIEIKFPSSKSLNRKEINKLIGKINEDGFSLIPTKIYFKKGLIIEIILNFIFILKFILQILLGVK